MRRIALLLVLVTLPAMAQDAEKLTVPNDDNLNMRSGHLKWMYEPVDLIISNPSGRVVVTVKAEGEIEIGPGYTPTAAADEFIRILREQYKISCVTK